MITLIRLSCRVKPLRAETERRKRAFLDGMAAGTFLLMPGGVSQAAACDGNWYSVAFGYDRVLPGTIPLN